MNGVLSCVLSGVMLRDSQLRHKYLCLSAAQTTKLSTVRHLNLLASWPCMLREGRCCCVRYPKAVLLQQE